MRSFTGSLTFSTLSISTLRSASPTFSTWKICTVWMMSRVSGSMVSGPRGLCQLMPVGAAVGLLQRFVDQPRAVVAADRVDVRIAVKLFVVGLDEFTIERAVDVGIVVAHGDDAERD